MNKRFKDWMIGRENRMYGKKHNILYEFYLFYRMCIRNEIYYSNKNKWIKYGR